MKPKIEIDSREKSEKIKEILTTKCGDAVEVVFKSGGPGDYIITDRAGNRWGIERKSFLDCYSSIITKDDAGRSKQGRIYGEITELVNEFGDRSIYLLEAPKYFPKRVGNPWQIMRIVYTFASERALALVFMMMRDETHTGEFLLKMAKNIHDLEFHGRGFKVTVWREEPDTKKRKA